ncbi:MAG TPA: YafY family protein [Burkholderiales bacterium]|nr:YafY family protein [Burkholderiales bacterium]
MDRLERFYKIDQLLKERRVVSFAMFKSELGMSPASVKRDLAYMRDRFNAPIDYDREANGYRFGEPREGPVYQLPGLWFNASEVLALLTTLRMLGDLQPGMLDGQIAPLRERLRKILGSGDHSWEEVEKRVRIFQPERRAGDPKHFGIAATAVLRRSQLWIRHYNRKKDEETERDISPQRLVHYRDNWYLDAWCHLRNDLRSFAVDAIREARLLDERAKEIADAELDAHLGAGYGIFAGKEVQWATLRFTPQAARWVAAQSWHPQQRSKTENDGSYVLELPFSQAPELVMEILKYGADVEVLEPPSLRERVAAALREGAKRYGNSGSEP